MTAPPPAEPKIYHIVHVDRLSSIIADGNLWCDAEIMRREAGNPGTRHRDRVEQHQATTAHQTHPRQSSGTLRGAMRAVLLLPALGHALRDL